MNMPLTANGMARNSSPVPQDGLARTDGRLQRNTPLMRKYEVAHLAPNGDIIETFRIAPAHPVFEEAFSAFARGLVVQTENGPVAVEDLIPGDRVRTSDGEFRTLKWKGSMMVIPETQSSSHLTRISTDTFGIHRPQHDVVLGPAARVFHRAYGVRDLTGHDGAFVPVADFTDGVSVIELSPQTPVQVFHLGFDGHERICAAGLEIESYHPGPAHRFPLRGHMLDLFMSLFPHKKDLTEFGLSAHPRLRLEDLELFMAA